jgi:hypothetical protein
VVEANFTETDARRAIVDDTKRMSDVGAFSMEGEPEIAAFATQV